MKQSPNKTKREKLRLKECAFSDFLSRLSGGQALLEVLGMLLGVEPSLHTHRAHLPVALGRAIFGSQASHCVHTEVGAERAHVARVRCRGLLALRTQVGTFLPPCRRCPAPLSQNICVLGLWTAAPESCPAFVRRESAKLESLPRSELSST